MLIFSMHTVLIHDPQFEVCGHKYADLSEFGYGVAILSESKYGFSCLGNVLSISLLRAATAPDADQDQGMSPLSLGRWLLTWQLLQAPISSLGLSMLTKATSWSRTFPLLDTFTTHPFEV